jgi:ParB/RepB/Spo0J family partition protein
MVSKLDKLKKSVGSRLNDDAGHRPQAVGTSHLHGALLIELNRITPDPEQPRKDFDKDELELLAKSLKGMGQKQPINVRYDKDSDKYIIISGERRYRAAKLAKLPALQAIVDGAEMTADSVRSIQLVENALRADLKPLEAAAAYKELMASMGVDQNGLAKFLNISQSKVSRTLALSKLSPAEQAKIEAGEKGAMSAVVKKAKTSKVSKAKARNKVEPTHIRLKSGAVTIKPKSGFTFEDVVAELSQHLATNAVKKAA